jgi:hypothetical protein
MAGGTGHCGGPTDLITTGITTEEREAISAEEPGREVRDWAEIKEWAPGIADSLGR